MTTGERIALARKDIGLTQEELANRLGIPYQSISQWERGLRNPKWETLEKIAAALGVSVEVLAGKAPARFVTTSYTMIKIKELRIKVGLTTGQMAKKLGMPRLTYIAYENGKKEPPKNLLYDVSDALDIPISDIVGQVTGPVGISFPPVRQSTNKALTYTSDNLVEIAQMQIIADSFSQLNDDGKKKLLERLEELTQMPKYTAQKATDYSKDKKQGEV